ncbi:MAG TPA: RsmE family RNA methyltransferase [Kiritimatiellia bacterium]|nr:RsmE family RNA methyltransferase [Kiritimatiellia bacterium]
MNIILLEQEEVRDGITVLEDDRAGHIRKVLHLKEGDSLRIGLVNGPRGQGTISEIKKHAVRLRCEFENEMPPESRIDVLLALPRPKVLKRLWAPLASMGVGHVVLTNAWKVERNYFDTHVLEEKYYRPRLIEGLQQAGDTHLPDVHLFRTFTEMMERLDEMFPASLRLLADPSGRISVHDAVLKSKPDRILLAVGPEGGWIPQEIESLCAKEFQLAGMGPRILRTDVACISLLALANDALE